jgi:four helix bundle protein
MRGKVHAIVLAFNLIHHPDKLDGISRQNQTVKVDIFPWVFVIGMREVVSQANELRDRLIDFAMRIIKLANALPDSPAAKHIARQLLRSGTSPTPNYAEARGAESSADFVHKLRIALQELNETNVWLRMICRADLMKNQLMEELIDENQQLCRIMNSSAKTASQKMKREKEEFAPSMTNDYCRITIDKSSVVSSVITAHWAKSSFA